MTPEQRAKIIEEFMRDHVMYVNGNNPSELLDFVSTNDLGIPFALGVTYGFISLNEEGINIINHTYGQLCALLDVPADEDFEDFEDMLLWIEDNEV